MNYTRLKAYSIFSGWIVCIAMIDGRGALADPSILQNFFIAAGADRLPPNSGPTPAPNFQVNLSAPNGATNRLLFSSNLTDWVFADTLATGSNDSVFSNVWQWPADRLFVRAAQRANANQFAALASPRLEIIQLARSNSPSSSIWHPHRMAIFGSSVALGVGAPNQNGWASRLASALGTNWIVVNKSMSGDNTTGLLGRFDRDIASGSWDVVVIALSLANEGIMGANPDAIYQGYLVNMTRLVERVRQIGAVPIVTGAYPNNGYTPAQAEYCRRVNRWLSTNNVAGINFMDALDDGTGHWASGYWTDDFHPNAAGHEEMFRAIPLSLFDHLLSSNAPVASAICSAAMLDEDTTTVSHLQYASELPLHSFTTSFWFRNVDTAPAKTLLGVGTNTSRVHTPDGWLHYTTARADLVWTNANPTLDQAWHHCAVAHSHARNLTFFYVDGQPAGSVSEHFESVSQLTLSGRGDGNASGNARQAEFQNWTLHRGCLDSSEVQLLYSTRVLKDSLELYSPLNDFDFSIGTVPANLAPNNGAVQIHSPSLLADPSADCRF